jgi:hypothetical protein
VKAHNGTLLNECADQLETLAAKRISHGPEIVVPQDQQEEAEDYPMSEDEITASEECDDEDQPRPGAIQVEMVGMAIEEQLEHQEEHHGTLVRPPPTIIHVGDE